MQHWILDLCMVRWWLAENMETGVHLQGVWSSSAGGWCDFGV